MFPGRPSGKRGLEEVKQGRRSNVECSSMSQRKKDEHLDRILNFLFSEMYYEEFLITSEKLHF
jgi:hypothetical protein